MKIRMGRKSSKMSRSGPNERAKTHMPLWRGPHSICHGAFMIRARATQQASSRLAATIKMVVTGLLLTSGLLIATGCTTGDGTEPEPAEPAVTPEPGQPEPNANPEPGANPEPEPTPQPGANPEPEPTPQPGANPEPEPNPEPAPNPEPEPGCSYPAGAPAVMALDQVLPTYSWSESIDAAGNNVPLDVTNVPCDNDANIDWSPFDVLLFVSIPAW